QGSVDLPLPNFGHGLCPVEPDLLFFAQCVARGNQTPVGCGAIACVEALDRLGVPGCTAAVTPHVASPGGGALAAYWTCKLIAKRNHYYTAPRNGVAMQICSTADSPSCNKQFVVQRLMADVRNQAPYVLEGPPSYMIARGRLQTPLPIDTSNPSRLYYLG